MILATTDGNKRKGSLKVWSLGDVHLHHPWNTTTEIIKNLYCEVIFHEEFKTVDLLLVNGDVFDRLIPFNHPDISLIVNWGIDLLKCCKKYGITVRFLEGTQSHDWGQSERFVTLNNSTGINADFKYVKDLSIEHIERLGISVLYVPDELNGSNTNTTLAQVKDLLEAHGVSQVDFASMHGMFDFQLPIAARAKSPNHNSEEYQKLVREAVFINHNHHFSRSGKIIAPGSFDRTAHGYEEPKGFVEYITDLKGHYEVIFRENKKAKVFKTVVCPAGDMEESLAYLSKVLGDYPDYSLIRLRADDDHPIFANFTELVRLFPLFQWTKDPQSRDDSEKEIDVGDESLLAFKPVNITPSNIASLLTPRIEAKATSQEVLDIAKRLLAEHLK